MSMAEISERQKRDLSVYRRACLTAPCPIHKNLNIKLYHFVNTAATTAHANSKVGVGQ